MIIRGDQMKRNLKDELLTKEEIEKLLETTTNPREKVIIQVMWETGLSPEEWLILKKQEKEKF